MKRSLAIVAMVVLLATGATAQEVQRKPLPRTHPLVGTWRIDFPNGCFEQYVIRADGTKLSESGAERNESIFEISEHPTPRGFYRWIDQITRGNGRPDCHGSVTEVGHVATSFIRLHPTGQRLLLCEAEDLKSCFAEFHRQDRTA